MYNPLAYYSQLHGANTIETMNRNDKVKDLINTILSFVDPKYKDKLEKELLA
jgi:hypothetical protein